jgi:hypothetical protein
MGVQNEGKRQEDAVKTLPVHNHSSTGRGKRKWGGNKI